MLDLLGSIPHVPPVAHIAFWLCEDHVRHGEFAFASTLSFMAALRAFFRKSK
jgi:hypothetical protein